MKVNNLYAFRLETKFSKIINDCKVRKSTKVLSLLFADSDNKVIEKKRRKKQLKKDPTKNIQFEQMSEKE